MLTSIQESTAGFLSWTGFYLRYRITFGGLNRSGRSTLLYLLKWGQLTGEEEAPVLPVGVNIQVFNPPTTTTLTTTGDTASSLISPSRVLLSLLTPNHHSSHGSPSQPSAKRTNAVEISGWDVGVGERERPSTAYERILDECYDVGDAVVWVVDCAVEDWVEDECVEESVACLMKVLRKHRRVREEVPLLILANKQDLPGAKTVGEIERAFEKVMVDRKSSSATNTSRTAVFPTSAKRGLTVESGLPQAFDWLNSAIKETRKQERSHPQPAPSSFSDSKGIDRVRR